MVAWSTSQDGTGESKNAQFGDLQETRRRVEAADRERKASLHRRGEKIEVSPRNKGCLFQSHVSNFSHFSGLGFSQLATLFINYFCHFSHLKYKKISESMIAFVEDKISIKANIFKKIIRVTDFYVKLINCRYKARKTFL